MQTERGLYDEITRLDEAKTVKELATRLKPLLERLAYLALAGEGAATLAEEAWHIDSTDDLYRHAEVPAEKSAPPATVTKVAAKGRPANTAWRDGGVPPSLMAILEGSHPTFRDEPSDEPLPRGLRGAAAVRNPR